jgi:diacylglycerol kinase family enzyme
MNAVPVFHNSASGQTADVEDRLNAAAAEAGIRLELRTVRPEGLRDAARRAAQDGTPVIGVAGGDGSASAAADGLAGMPATLAVFPAGTLNHFARALGIDSYDAAAQALAAGSVATVDVGEVNGRVFVNGVSFGLYPRSLRLRKRWEPRLGKWPAALLAACRIVVDYPRAPAWRQDSEDAAPPQPLVWVGPGRGSFRNPRVQPREMHSGLLELVVVSTRSRLRLLGLVRRAIQYGGDGLAACADTPRCAVHYLEEFAVSEALPDPIDAGLDGELIHLHPPLRFRIRPGALRVIAARASFGGERT